MSGPGIAVVGMACHYPDAHAPSELWQAVLTGRRAFRRIPPARLSPAYLGERADPDRTYVTHAGVLRDWEFDRGAFRVPVGVHRAVDHTHWLALQTAAEALADAGVPDADTLPREQVGVVLGNSLGGEFSRAAQLRTRWPFVARAAAAALRKGAVPDDLAAVVLAELESEVKGRFPEPTDETLAGALANTIAGRVGNHFDLRGGGYTVDGACSSSLLAVIHAARAVAAGELRFALAGGVDLSIDPLELVGFARVGVLGVDEMRVYDADPTGFLPGEGCGVLLLTTVDEARRRGMPVRAELVGWGISADGAGGLTRPSAAGQRRAMDLAYRMAGVDPSTVDFIEGHGTGTSVGDEAELTALSGLRGMGSPRAALGSVKANIGHTKAAAGVAGLIKAILAVHSGVLPPTTGCVDPHPLLRSPGTPLRTLTAPEPWEAKIRMASVSALGFGGINSHIVVGSDSPAMAAVEPVAWPAPRYDIVVLGADSATGLAERLRSLSDWFAGLSAAELHDVAASSGTDAPVRCALVASRPAELASAAVAAATRLDTWDGSLTVAAKAGFTLAQGPAPAVGLIFPGQAAPVRPDLSAWAAGLDVPAATAAIRAGDTDTAAAQPAIVRQSLAGLAWLAHLGCEAVGAVGHSLGEISALVWAGALDPAAALGLAAARGRVMAEHGLPATTMAALDVPAEDVAALTAGTSVVLACDNSPRRTSVGGPADEVAAVIDRATAAGVGATALAVSHAFHSPAMVPAREPMRAVLAGVEFARPRGAVTSTVTGGPLADANLAEVLLTQLTEPVRFRAAVTDLAARVGLLVEVGPGRTLSGLAADCAPGVAVVTLDCGGSARTHAIATATLIASGAVSAGPWFARRSNRFLPPGTPMSFLRNPCEADDDITPTAARREPAPVAAPATGADPLLALRTRLADECELDLAGITDGTSLSRDLHLSSLRIVTLVTRVAADLGRKTPQTFPAFADATVGEAAEVLAELEYADAHSETGLRGVEDWVRAFTHHWVPGVPRRAAGAVDWTWWAPEDHWLRAALVSSPGRTGLAAYLPPDAGPDEVAALLNEIGKRQPAVVVVVHHGHPAAAAVGRSAQSELTEVATTVVQVPVDATDVDPALIAGSGHQELWVRAGGSVEHLETTLHPHSASGPLPIGAGEVCVVTGGVTGITAHTAIALAHRSGCVLLFTGRRHATDPGVVDGLAAARRQVQAHYHRADITDPRAARGILAAARELGPVCGVLHGAAVNEPRLMSAVDGTTLRRVLSPKVDGLRNLLAAGEDDLRLVVAYGSIIGRVGLAGQSEYCVANDWLRHTLTDWAATHPDRRAHCVEWSLWSAVGMGARMGVVDGLAARGVVPLSPTAGSAALLDALARPDTPTTVMISGRFPDPGTLALTRPEVPLLRFLEETRTVTPGVEVVADTTLTPRDDPYLTEHRIDGVAVLPAVVGLEAVAQTALATTGSRTGWAFHDLDLSAPITGDDVRKIRIATLVDGDRVRARLTDDSDRFDLARLTVTIAPATEAPAPESPGLPPAVDGPHSYYGPLFFHSGRFARLLRYDYLSAFEVGAWIDTSGSDWFAGVHAQRLLLGDPGLLDASIHVLLACLPHRAVLPIGAGTVTVWQDHRGPAYVRARELRHTADEFAYTVDVISPGGDYIARWDNLRLRAVGPRPWTTPIPAPLIGPFLSRRLIECGIAEHIEIRSELVAGQLRLDTTDTAWLAVAGPAAEPDPLADALRDKTGESPQESSARAKAIRRVGIAGNPTILAVDGTCVSLGGDPARAGSAARVGSFLVDGHAIAVAVPGGAG
ncbi:type I polyketide synthase [Actinokineospora diospyrosa]|uniref:Enediyne polyketide synthase n=1 Tax=Actinokineospora diospyrosa TaxID=103728 RepID=A0ABT1IN54_9PSEU|nr:type I polyketide synthase [Actinokineospora diospyrosa]MCP2274103.1 enediyne polyketide synthase [Actinokineospora diospyrosa]